MNSKQLLIHPTRNPDQMILDLYVTHGLIVHSEQPSQALPIQWAIIAQ